MYWFFPAGHMDDRLCCSHLFWVDGSIKERAHKKSSPRVIGVSFCMYNQKFVLSHPKMAGQCFGILGIMSWFFMTWVGRFYSGCFFCLLFIQKTFNQSMVVVYATITQKRPDTAYLFAAPTVDFYHQNLFLVRGGLHEDFALAAGDEAVAPEF